MSIVVDPQTRIPHHVDGAAIIPRVPSKREAEAAYARLVANIDIERVDEVGADIELVGNFISSR